MVKKMWTDDRSELTMKRIQSLAMIKFNTNQSCTEFYSFLKDQPDVLQAIKSKQKYSIKAKPCGVLKLSNDEMDNNTEHNEETDHEETEHENTDDSSDDY